MKLFEYMASGKPIIVSDLPTTRMILSEQEASFVRPNSNQSYVSIVKQILLCHGVDKKVDAARRRVRENTWKVRAMLIVQIAKG